MGRKGCLALLCNLLLIGLAHSAQIGQILDRSQSTPAFLWSDQSYLDATHRTNYQTLPAESILKGLLRGLVQASNDTATDAKQPSILLAYVGQKVRGKHLGGPDLFESALAPLKAALGAADSSLVLPHVTLEGKRSHLAVALEQGIGRAAYQGAQIGQVALAGPCASALAETERIDLADVKAYLEKRATEREEGFTDVLVVCSAHAEERLSEAAGLAAEVNELIKVHEIVKETTPDYIAAYLCDPTHGGFSSSTHRVLQALNDDPSAGNATTCNQLCQTKAVIIESALIGLLLIVILLCGFGCQFNLDTPTKFDTPRE